MNLTDSLMDFARGLGFDLVGFAGAEPFFSAYEVLWQRKKGGLYAPFAPADLKRACTPEQVLADARSIIAVGMGYHQGEFPALDGYRGFLSRFAWGRDYHLVLGERLQQLQAFLQREVAGSKNMIFADKGPLLDKEVAKRAGLGWFGKNSLIINEDFGSWVFLGGILTTVQLIPDSPKQSSCGDCTNCIRACPTGALLAPGVLDPNRCLAYLTQAKGYLPREMRSLLGLRLYGCDTCQEVCTYNRSAAVKANSDFIFPVGERQPDLLKLIELNNREFKGLFGSTSVSWRGRTVLQRNSLVVLGNYGDRELAPHLLRFLDDPRPIIRAHTAWALGRLGGKRAMQALSKAITVETDAQVWQELDRALKEEY